MGGSEPDFTVVDIDECVSVPAYEAELVLLRHGLGAKAWTDPSSRPA
jgi:hypothetical protein